jgi:shikimate dehydrogenase
MQTFGLIGKKLTHSFSKRYFTEKFKKENIQNAIYELFELPTIADLPALIKNQPHLKGLNVTIPYKLEVLPFLDKIDAAAQKIGAVNVIKINDNKILTGYNSDYYGFKESLLTFLHNSNEFYISPNSEKMQTLKALILGTGGASKAVKVALEDLEISYLSVSRSITKDTTNESNTTLTYEQLDEDVLKSYQLIINTTPLGMYPQIEICPDIPYQFLTSEHYLYDLVYNPENTLFMQKGAEEGAKVINGLQMLYLQAEKSWEIWNQ